MAVVTVAGEDYYAYVDVDMADTYILPTFNNITWAALTDDNKGRGLIQATRFLDSLSWADAYDTQAEREVAQDIINVCIELAALIGSGETTFLGVSAPAAEQKRLKAGSVELENFRNLTTITGTTQYSGLPVSLFAILKPYLAVGAAIGGAFSSGTDGTSTATDSWGFSWY